MLGIPLGKPWGTTNLGIILANPWGTLGEALGKPWACLFHFISVVFLKALAGPNLLRARTRVGPIMAPMAKQGGKSKAGANPPGGAGGKGGAARKPKGERSEEQKAHDNAMQRIRLER